MQLSNLDLSEMYTYDDYLKWQLDDQCSLLLNITVYKINVFVKLRNNQLL